MKNLIVIFISIIFIISCNDEIKKPENLIERDEMKAIIKDIYLYRQVKNHRIINKMPDFPEMNLAVLDKHGVTLDQFKESYQFYIVDQAKYDEFLLEIKEELEAELPDAAQEKLSKKDSLVKDNKKSRENKVKPMIAKPMDSLKLNKNQVQIDNSKE